MIHKRYLILFFLYFIIKINKNMILKKLQQKKLKLLFLLKNLIKKIK